MTDTVTDPQAPPDAAAEPLLTVEDLYVTFQKGNQAVQAVAGISFTLRKGETLGLVGESGCGKTTTGRAVVQVERATSGKIRFGDTELTALGRGDLRTLRTQVQMIFQDPISSLNPRRRVRDIVAEPLTIWRIGTKEERQKAAYAMLEEVGIDPYLNGSRRPREFSGGQCQRISIARALVLKPKLLVCDEIVSALDVSVQAQILNLLEDLKNEFGLTLLFIAHDLAVVKNVSDRVAVMYLGRLCEVAPSDVLYQAPAHHYTSALLASTVEPDPEAPRGGAAFGRTAEPDQPAFGLSLPHPLPKSRGAMCRGGARAAGDRTRPPGGLPLSHRHLTDSDRAGAAPAPRRIVAAACPAFPNLHDDWPPLRATLARRGVEADAAVWSDPDVDWSAYDLVLANGAWDNIHHVDAFLCWVDDVSGALGVPVVNSPAVLRWNIDKRYLRDLEAAGVPVVPTIWVEPGGDPDPALLGLPVGEIVVKPSVSGGGFQTARYRPDEHHRARRHVADLVRSGRTAMVQPYQQAVDDVGEIGLIFVGGVFSHAMHKDPMIPPGAAPTDSLIEFQLVTPASASAAQVELGHAAVAAAEQLHGPSAYARVDTVEADDGQPVLLELEMLDPVLFFDTDPAGAERFADVLMKMV